MFSLNLSRNKQQAKMRQMKKKKQRHIVLVNVYVYRVGQNTPQVTPNYYQQKHLKSKIA